MQVGRVPGLLLFTGFVLLAGCALVSWDEYEDPATAEALEQVRIEACKVSPEMEDCHPTTPKLPFVYLAAAGVLVWGMSLQRRNNRLVP